MALANRMAKELKMLRKSPPQGVCAWAEGDSTTRLAAQVQGPAGTVYEAGVFRLAVEVPERYPFEPPKVTFTTRVFHPNIDASGRVCLDVLDLPPKGSWRPSLNLVTILAAVRQLLAEPNPDDPLDQDATEAYVRNRPLFDATARRMVAEHAGGGAGAAAKPGEQGGEDQQQQQGQQQGQQEEADKPQDQPQEPREQGQGLDGGDQAAAGPSDERRSPAPRGDGAPTPAKSVVATALDAGGQLDQDGALTALDGAPASSPLEPPRKQLRTE